MRLPARTTCIFALVLFIAIALDQNVARVGEQMMVVASNLQTNSAD
jgi:hypothetical protein